MGDAKRNQEECSEHAAQTPLSVGSGGTIPNRTAHGQMRGLARSLVGASGLFAALLAPLGAEADDHRARQLVGDYVFRPGVATRPIAAPGGSILFMNRNGGTYTSSWTEDSSRNESTIIAFPSVEMPAYPHGDDSWNEVMQCMRDLYADFNVLVTDEDPGATPHLEVVVSGSPVDIGMAADSAGGVALGTCEPIRNAIVYAFAGIYPDVPQWICQTAGQESAHAYGLDHGYLCEDIMTYIDLEGVSCGPKTFVDQGVDCGEYSPRGCVCGSATQNSHQYLLDVFGPAVEQPPTVSIKLPADGADVEPGFSVQVEASDYNGIAGVELRIDDILVDTCNRSPCTFVTASNLGSGTYEVAVRAYDTRDVTADAQISVTVRGDEGGQGPWDQGPGDVADPNLPDDVGDACSDGEACSSSACVMLGKGDGYCTRSCAADPCPTGFTCEDDSLGAYCMLSSDGSHVGLGSDPVPYGLTATCAFTGQPSRTPTIPVALLVTGLVALGRRRRT